MKLYLVERNDDIDWDEYDSFVILAKNDKDALNVALSINWCCNVNAENLNITRIHLTGKSGPILGSFNAG